MKPIKTNKNQLKTIGFAMFCYVLIYFAMFCYVLLYSATASDRVQTDRVQTDRMQTDRLHQTLR